LLRKSKSAERFTTCPLFSEMTRLEKRVEEAEGASAARFAASR
jgi:hypothetical protein